MRVEVSIIIVNYNTADLLAQCLASIYAQTENLNFEIILVDNGSTERSVEQVAINFPAVKFLQLSSNIGFGKACNAAVKKATGATLFFLNSDSILCNNAIAMLYDFYIANATQLQLSCLGSELKSFDGKDVHSHASFPLMSSYLIKKISSILSRFGLAMKVQHAVEHDSDFYKVDYVTGANLMISKDNFDLVSGFDPDYFLYFEETDLQLRLAALGLQSYIVKGPIIMHKQGASTQQNQSLLRFYFFNSMHIYFKKHNTAVSYFFFKCCWFFLDIKTIVQNFKINRKIR